MKKSELEQIIKEEIEAVFAENPLKKKIFNPAYKYVKDKAKSYLSGKSDKLQKPKSRTSLNRINLFSKVKKVEVHQPKLDKMGRPDGIEILKIDPAEAQNITRQALVPLKGYYDILGDQLLGGSREC